MFSTACMLVCFFSTCISGTGKSVTGAHIAYVFAKLNQTLNSVNNHKCVLYCGPSNKSVDVVFGKE